MGRVGQIAFAVGGAFIGGAFGRPDIGFAVGNLLGASLFGAKPQPQPGSRLSDLSIQGSEYGATIPIFYGGTLSNGLRGGVPATGQFIDANPMGGIEEVVSNVSQRRGTGGKKSSRGSTTTEYTYFLTAALMFGEGEQGLEKFNADEKVLFDKYAPNGTFVLQEEPYTGALVSDKFRWYPGNFRQLPDSALQQFHGGVVPAYRGVCYCVLYKYPLAGHQNRVPTFRAVLANGVTRKREMVRRHMIRAGIPTNRVDLCEITGELQGAFQTSQSGARDFCEKIAAHSLCELMEFDGKIKDISKKNAYSFEVPQSELAAHMTTDELPPTFVLSVQQDEEIPNQASIRFMDSQNNWEPNVAIGLGQFGGNKNSELSLEMPIVDTLANMVPLAQIVIDEAIAGRYSLDLALMPKYIRRVVGNVMNVQMQDGRIMRFRVTGQSMGLPGAIITNARSYDPKVYPGHRVVTQVKKPQQKPSVTGVPTIEIFQTVSLNDDMVALPTFIIAASGQPDLDYSGVFIDFDDTSIEGTSILTKAVMGYSANAVTTKPDNTFDYDQTLKVTILDGELGGCEIEDILNSEANTAILGQSVIRWTDAEQTGPHSWELTGLLFGQLGSDYIKTIPNGTPFLLLRDQNGTLMGGFDLVTYDLAKIGNTVKAEIMVPDQTQSEFKSLVLQGNNIKALSPGTIQIERDEVAETVTFSWDERSRYDSRANWTTGALRPSESVPPVFEIDFKDGDTIVHTATVTTDTFLVIPFADIATWYGSSSDKIEGVIYQTNAATVGRGFGRKFAEE